MLEINSVSWKGASHKINQDTASVFNNPDKRLKGIIVYDGHGENGHLISAAAAKTIPKVVTDAIISGNYDVKTSKQNIFLGKEQAIADALSTVDVWMGSGDFAAVSDCSGTTVAGILYDTVSRCACMFAVGDSLVGIFEPGMDAIVLEPQNVHFLQARGNNADSKMPTSSHVSLIENVLDDPDRVDKSKGAMITPDGLLQLYSVVGDFDAKKFNKYIGIYPTVVVINRQLSKGTKLIVASDGAYDHVAIFKKDEEKKPHSTSWVRALTFELEQANWSAKNLALRAISRGIRDDITAIIAKI